MNLKTLGWNADLEKAFARYHSSGLIAGRVAVEHRGMYRVYSAEGEQMAVVTGKMRHEAETRADYPAVGDWVVLQETDDTALIHGLLPRKSKFSRKEAGETTEEQIIAANIDTVFLVTALNQDFNPRRIERAMLLAWESGANPVIVLSKADLCEDVDQRIRDVESITLGIPIHVISSLHVEGLDTLLPYLSEGSTVALLGSSGVGKSTLINTLIGEQQQAVGAIREGDDRGRHTTTHRELIALPRGGLIIDTPGFRELQLWDTDEGFSHTFSDVEALAEKCQFNDCHHQSEPGCAVREAIEIGELTSERFANYQKMQRELQYLAGKMEQRQRVKEKGKKYTRRRRHRQRLID